MTYKPHARDAYRPHPRVITFTEHDADGVIVPSRTHQSFKDECDIKNILKKYQSTGMVDHVNKHAADYGEMPSHADFSEAMNLMTSAQSMFNELPSSVRRRFENNPGLFLDWVSDPENVTLLNRMGPQPSPDELGELFAHAAPTPPEPPAESPATPSEAKPLPS